MQPLLKIAKNQSALRDFRPTQTGRCETESENRDAKIVDAFALSLPLWTFFYRAESRSRFCKLKSSDFMGC